MTDDKDLSPAGKAIVFSGLLVGLIAGGAASFYFPMGMIPAVLLCMICPIIGGALMRPLALAVSKRNEKKGQDPSPE